MAERAPPREGETSERRKGKDDSEAKPERNGTSKSLPPPPPSSTPARHSRAPSMPPPATTPPPPEDPHPSIPPLPAAGPWRSYKEIVAGLAQRIVDAQRPIRVLQAVRWDNSIEEQFRKS